MMENLLNIALEAAIGAGIKIMEVYHGKDFEIESKHDNSPLTRADKVANAVINNHLERTGIPIISEENKLLGYDERKDWTRCWIVDPLDGTKEFIKRNGEFTVNIALVENGKPILGIIYTPVNRELYYALVPRQKAYKVLLDTDHSFPEQVLGQKGMLGRPKKKSSRLRIVGSRSHMNQETMEYLKELKKSHNSIDVVPKGSSLKFCLIAEGKADIYPRFAPTMEWDTAAGHAICNALYIKVLNVKKNGAELTYNKPDFRNDYFIVKATEK